jgi:hypothetical protein
MNSCPLYHGLFEAMVRPLALTKNGKCHCKHVFTGKFDETQSNYPLTLDVDGYNAALLMRPLI